MREFWIVLPSSEYEYLRVFVEKPVGIPEDRLVFVKEHAPALSSENDNVPSFKDERRRTFVRKE